MTMTEKIIEPADIPIDKIVRIAIMNKSLDMIFCDDLNYDNFRQFIEKPITPDYLEKLILDITKHPDLFNSNLNQYPEKTLKVNPFEVFVYYLFSQLFPCIWFGFI
jgi:hypothetical protein